MNEKLLNHIKKLREINKKRNFVQTAELQVALKDIDLTKVENRIEDLVVLPYGLGKKRKICAFVGPETYEEAKQIFDKVILVDEFSKYDKKSAKKLVREYDFFVAQANIMPQVAKYFGRYLGPLNKMPNPKLGLLFPPKGAKLKDLYDKLQKSVAIVVKKAPLAYAPFGVESMKDEELAENLEILYKYLSDKLPNKEGNIKRAVIKFTMSKSVKIK
ncbi:MAG TPA: 50S ribosomal protein L1 [Nautiliaceae bacterium]|nr:50S ribosomal protein L1 [Nautiliaceae bacterium]